jgi:vacuolar-type H+-ATPase subunit E/Vma4
LSLVELKGEIDKKAQEEIAKILENAKGEADKLISEATTRAEALRDQRMKALQRELDSQEKAELATSRMAQKGELLSLKSKWANRVFQEAEKRISEIADKSGQGYEELLKQLVIEGITSLNGDRFLIETNPRDLKTITKQLSTITDKASKLRNSKVILETAVASTPILGGAIVSKVDGTQYYNNTIEARLSMTTRNLAGRVYEMLFGGGETK